MLSAICFNLGQSKILSYSNGFKVSFSIFSKGEPSLHWTLSVTYFTLTLLERYPGTEEVPSQ